MDEYSVRLKRSAVKEVAAIGTQKDRRRIVARIGALATNPRPPDSTKLSGSTDVYRIRHGSYRIVYIIDDAERAVTIVKVGHRKDVYR